MGEKVKVTLTNREAADKRVGLALGYLSTEKAVGFTLALQIADLQMSIEKQVERFEKAKINLCKSLGARRTGRGYVFDEETGDPAVDARKKIAPAEFYDELDKLKDAAVEHDLEQIDLPNGKDDTYQPIIFTMLGKFIKRK